MPPNFQKPKVMKDGFEQAAGVRERIAQKLQGQQRESTPAAPVQPPPVASKGELKERILQAAAQLFRSRGVGAVQLSDVAEAAGVPLAKVLEQTLNAEELLHQVLVHEVTRFLAEADPLLDATIPVTALMAALSEFSFGYIEGNELLLQLMLGVVDDAVPAWSERFHLLRQRCHTVIVRALKIGIQQRVLRPDLVPELVAALLFEIHIAGYLLHYRPGNDRKLRAEQRRIAALEMIFKGLEVREET